MVLVKGEDRTPIRAKVCTCSDTRIHRIVWDMTSLENVCQRLQRNGGRSWAVVGDANIPSLAVRGEYLTVVPGEHRYSDAREAVTLAAATVALEPLTEVRMLSIVDQLRMENKDIDDGRPSCLRRRIPVICRSCTRRVEAYGCYWTSENQMKVRINHFDSVTFESIQGGSLLS